MRLLKSESRSGPVLVLCLLPLLITLWPSCGQGEGDFGGAPGDWLSSFKGARSLGLGGALVAAGSEPLGVVWNPACLTRLYRNELHFETARLFFGTSINSFSLAVPARRLPTVGFTALALRSADIERTSELNEPLGSFRQGETAFLFSASKNLTRSLMMGGNLKIVRQVVEEYGDTGVGFDLGLLCDLTRNLRVGASFLNLGGPTLTLRQIEETYPRELRVGISLQVLSGRALIATEFDRRPELGNQFQGGGEFWIHPRLVLRLGHTGDRASGGFSFLLSRDTQVDYGLADHELGVTHRIGVSYRFGGFFAATQADPPVFSPLGYPAVTKFLLRARTKAEAEDWVLRIVNTSDQVVRQFGGKGAPPAHVMWDGKDETGLPAPDGVYRHQIIVTDEEGREVVSEERAVEITTSGPQGDVPISVEHEVEGATP